MAMKSLKFRITGVLPLVQHDGMLADPLNPISKQIKEISSKRKKVDADYAEMARLEFHGALYLNKAGNVILSGPLVEGAIFEAAKKERKGKSAQAAVYVPSDSLLEYDGPKTADEMWKDGRFRYSTGVRVGQARIIRTRAQFEKWSAEIEVQYDPGMMNESDVVKLIEVAGEQVGIGARRPRFGRFSVERLADKTVKAA